LEGQGTNYSWGNSSLYGGRPKLVGLGHRLRKIAGQPGGVHFARVIDIGRKIIGKGYSTILLSVFP
jgi:hypothetical protein